MDMDDRVTNASRASRYDFMIMGFLHFSDHDSVPKWANARPPRVL